MNDVRDVAKDIQSPIEAIDRNLKNLEGFTEPLGRNGEQVSRSLIDGLNGLSRIVEEVTVLIEALNSRDGTIGRLIHDPAVYDNLNRVLCNSNQVVLQINKSRCGCGRSSTMSASSSTRSPASRAASSAGRSTRAC